MNHPKLRLAAALWFAATIGVLIATFTVIPQLHARTGARVPLWIAAGASTVQSSLLVALAAWAGVALSKQLGLRAPAIEAALSGGDAWAALKPQLVAAAIVGAVVEVLLVVLARVAPAEITKVGQAFDIPFAAKLLYGGVTEEVIMRWGLMSVFVWLPWRFIQRRNGLPRDAYVVAAIVFGGLLFGAGHLPAVAAMGVPLTASVVTYIVFGNSLPGMLFGALFWRKGLEAAIIAHALAHAISVAMGV
ncbi:MAG: CPBP family glutamic-type intramembrane protease [Casimicrobium sp.]